MELKNKKALVIGMARSGVAAAKLLKTLGAQVILNDSKQMDNIEGLPANEYIYKTGISPDSLVGQADLIVISPSVPSPATSTPSYSCCAIAMVRLGVIFSFREASC